jgi:YbbR domain-containing protein
LTVSPNEIKVWGPQSIIDTVDKLVVAPDLSKITEDFSEEFAYTAVSKDDKNIDLINVSSYVQSVRVSGEILNVKTLPLELAAERIYTPFGYHISEASVEPRRLVVRGTATAFADVESLAVRVDPSLVSAEVGTQELKGEVVLPTGITADEEKTTVSVKIILEEAVSTTNE